MDYKTDEEKMEVALKQAKIAFDKNEVPVGAAIFDVNNKLICACLLYTSDAADE